MVALFVLLRSKNVLELYLLMSDLEKAADYKAKGNAAFKEKNWGEAIEMFSQAIQHNPNDHVFYSNRSASYLNSGQHD